MAAPVARASESSVGKLAYQSYVSQRVICSGPFRGKQSTYALLARRAADPTRLSRDEALAELTGRYFRSHGPATIRDFVWWSGLTIADAKRGLEDVAAHYARFFTFDERGSSP